MRDRDTEELTEIFVLDWFHNILTYPYFIFFTDFLNRHLSLSEEFWKKKKACIPRPKESTCWEFRQITQGKYYQKENVKLLKAHTQIKKQVLYVWQWKLIKIKAQLLGIDIPVQFA